MFRLTLHQEGSDVGHGVIVGETGAGKSVLVAMMAAGHRKYPGSRVIFIDRGASAKGITLALGGSYHELAAGAAVSLQPLVFIDEPASPQHRSRRKRSPRRCRAWEPGRRSNGR